jgi:fatty-acyl-CoA synthase
MSLEDVVIWGGENVYRAEVENALLERSAVAECAVFAVSHRTLGALKRELRAELPAETPASFSSTKR